MISKPIRVIRLKRLWVNSFSVGLLAVCCVASLLFIYGGPRSTRLEASSLASAVVSEFVGTPAFVAPNKAAHQPMSAVLSTFGVPLANPVSMVVSQYPTAVSPNGDAGSSQTSLMSPITHWAQASPTKIAMGWIPSGASTSGSIQLIQANPGMNVVSPTWFQLWSGSGMLKSYVQPGVVRYAHQHHVQVWGMVDNQYSSTLAHEFLTNPKAQQRFIQSLVHAAVANQLDGINLDFENMHTSDQKAYTAFVGALHHALGKYHMKLSVDITPDIVFLRDTDVYFHAGLAANADYVIVMAYDEHWSTDNTPGPVADMPWVTTALTDLLNTGVPSDRLVLGVPFYTYFWHVATDGSVSATAYATSDVPSILQSHQATGTWNSRLQLGYARYPKPDGYEEVWYETQKTLQDQTGLVNHLGLAGIAVWSLTWSDPHGWSVLTQALRNSVS